MKAGDIAQYRKVGKCRLRKHIQGEGWCQLWDVEWLTGRYKKLTGYDETWISDTEIIEHAEQ
jgi:hypothetical protein